MDRNHTQHPSYSNPKLQEYHQHQNADRPVEFDEESGTYIYKDETGITFEWDQDKNAWFPRYDELLISQQQSIYKVDGVDENEHVLPPGLKRKLEKGTNEYEEDHQDVEPGRNENTNQHKKSRSSENGQNKNNTTKRNTAVYVSGLPDDVTEEEIEKVFSKYGVILEDIKSGKAKIKLYRDPNGRFQGNALVIYFKEESVKLSCELLDDSDFRVGKPSKIRVEPAVFQNKKSQENNISTTNQTVDKQEKNKVKAKMQRLTKRLDWDDTPEEIQSNKHTKTVILKNMFTLKELEDDPALLIDLKEDVREECEKLGEVTNVVMYDKNEEGVMSVRFREQESAVICVKKMNGRYFAGRTLQAYIYDGREKFVKKTIENLDLDQEEQNEKERLDKYAKWLESQEN